MMLMVELGQRETDKFTDQTYTVDNILFYEANVALGTSYNNITKKIPT